MELEEIRKTAVESLESIAEKFGQAKTKVLEISKIVYENAYMCVDAHYQSMKNRYKSDWFDEH